MTTLIFDDRVYGHHLEYLHHLHLRVQELLHHKFVFAVPEAFKTVSKNSKWKEASNISFVFFKEDEVKTGFSRCRLLAKLVKKHRADKVFLISLMSFLPWLPFFIPARTKVSGIIYLIYLYRWKKSSFKTRILDVLKYLIFSRFGVFERVFLLNDKAAPCYLNQKFKTQKFEYLPDPVAISLDIPFEDLRLRWNVAPETKIFAHFGSLAIRKGTLELLKAIILANIPNAFFVFAGRVGSEIHEEFYELLGKARSLGVQILVVDKFCSYEFLMNLSRASDAIFIPYQNTEQSSGIIAYAAAAGTPVFSPSSGLLGKLVRRYHLGKTSSDISVQSIASAMNDTAWISRRDGKKYLLENSTEQFTQTIFQR